VTPAFVAGLPPARARALAVALLVIAVAGALALLVVPLLLLHQHYDTAIESLTTRLTTYRRVAAQAPALRTALDSVRGKDGRRFYLKNTAPNLAGAELQELVRAAIENNGGRITTTQNIAPRDDGRFKQIGVNMQFFATTAALQKVLTALESGPPYLVVENLTLRPVNAFRGFKPGPGQEPEIVVQLDVVAWAYEPAKPAGGDKK
jgi:general secretion pathway protein M